MAEKVKYRPITIKIMIGGVVIGEITPPVFFDEKLNKFEIKRLKFSRIFSDPGIPKIDFNIEKSLKNAKESGSTATAKIVPTTVFLFLDNSRIRINLKCG